MSADPSRPAPTAAAPALARVRAQGGFELGLLLRNGEQLLVSLILPLGALVGLALSSVPSLGAGRRIDVATPGVLALCVISSAFTAQAIATGFDRRYAVLRYLGVTPLGRDGLLAGKVLATLAMVVLQTVVVGGVGLLLGWRPAPWGWVIAPVFLALGVWVFVALALVLAGLLRAEGVLAVANLLWVLFLVLGGVVIPRGESGWGALAGWLPSAALADGLRSAFIDGRVLGGAAAVLVGWGLVSTAVASRTFRWSD